MASGSYHVTVEIWPILMAQAHSDVLARVRIVTQFPLDDDASESTDQVTAVQNLVEEVLTTPR